MVTEIAGVQRHRLTVADFQKMNEAGILDSKARIELIDGELVDMSPIGPSHAGTVNYLSRQLTFAVGDRGLIATQTPIVLDEHNQPQPDITVLKFNCHFYRQSHPRSEDILLLVEVADSSTRVDRNEKILRYARFGIPECWLVDIPQKVLEIYRNPGPRGFQIIQRPAIISHISLSQLPKVNVDVSHLFG